MRVTFLGVRGSTPAPGRQYLRYGGHTSCVAITAPGQVQPSLVLDAGTGLRDLTDLLDGGPFRGDILLSHLHWDHIQGIPFFRAGDHDEARIRLWVPAQDGRSGRDLLAQQMSPPAFPITPEGLRGDWTFHAVQPGQVAVPGFTVTCAEVAHKGGRTYAYRITDRAGASIGYAPDHAPAAGISPQLQQLLVGVDLLIHDAQFTESEREIADAYGHATIDDARSLAEQVSAGTLALFHHGPGRTDAALDELLAHLPQTPAVIGAAAGLSVTAAAGRVEVLDPAAAGRHGIALA